MDYLPLFLRVEANDCLLVGGGDVALRKARLLRRAGARLNVVAPDVLPELAQLASESGGTVHQRAFEAGDLDGCVLVVAASDDMTLNAGISSAARARGLPVNVVDQPELCSVIFPSVVDRSPLLIAVSSGGKAPVLARQLRAQLETLIPAGWGRVAALAGRFRERVKQQLRDFDQRLRFWESVFDGPIAEQVLAGRDAEAEASLELALQQAGSGAGAMQGEVFLVGAGPGDPDLLTFKALRLMQKADVVLYDRLVAPGIMALVRQDAERIYVGKARSEHALTQPAINQLLLDLARQGRRVLRLKGGDPFIFGRGGEEIELLARAGVPFQVVPGITAASGCACYAGIPLTHRDHAQSVRFVTGHRKDGTTDLPWNELVQTDQTVVFYMGLVGLPEICAGLIAHGRDPQTPIALIENGTLPQQRVITGCLADFPERVAAAAVKAPTLLIVGEVVSLRGQLSWFQGDKPIPPG